MQGPQLEAGAEAAAQMITRFVHSQFLAFHNKPPYANTSESKQIKLAAKHFHFANIYMRVLHSDKIVVKLYSQRWDPVFV